MVIAVLLFGVIIFVHEFGHFFTAKLSGIRVNEFAIGMGPTIFKRKKGETQYSLRLFPIGGFCAMEGEDGESEDDRAFVNKPVWKRIIVVAAGAVMNVLLGIVIMMILLGQQSSFLSTTISKFTENSATQAAGLEVGDQFYSVNGYRIYTDRDLSFALGTANPEDVDIVVSRDGEKIEFPSVALNTVETEDGQKIGSLDFYVQPIERNPIMLITKSAADTVSIVRLVWGRLVGLVTGQYKISDLSGPVGTASAISQVASMGLKESFGTALNNILMLMAIITVNLGVFNLLPLPALDGGRLVFLLIEGIFRRPVAPKYEGWIHAAGFILIMGLVVVVTFSDILRLITGKGMGG